jgi:DNA-binding LacI/PurR family transcriptional regulator
MAAKKTAREKLGRKVREVPSERAASSGTKRTPTRRTPTSRATIKSVAERAGVSIATVSFVLNDRPGQVISEPVKKRVHEAARLLNYAPSAAAATLARKQTANVAIVFYGNEHLITNPFYSYVVEGAIKEAAEREFNILFSFMPEGYAGAKDLPKVIREKNAEGVLFMQSVSPALVDDIRDKGLALVAVDCYPRLEGLDTVGVDNHEGARLAGAHLLDAGHKEVVMLTAPSDIPSLDDRAAGFVAELHARGLQVTRKQAVIEAEKLDFWSGYEKAKELLRLRPAVSGIFCANDEMAAGVLRAAREMGRPVPESLSVIGFDDILMSRYLDPPLSTISFDKEAMGRRAMRRLLEQVTKGAAGAPHQDVLHQVVPVLLVARGSTGPFKSGRG